MERKQLEEFTNAFWKLENGRISDSLKFDDSDLSDFSSIRFFQFLTAIEANFDLELEDVASIHTFRDLVKRVS
jgi:acyl carrier protein